MKKPARCETAGFLMLAGLFQAQAIICGRSRLNLFAAADLVCRVEPQMEAPMTKQDSSHVHIDRTHSGAIRAEVADRLRGVLKDDQAGMPPNLLRLTRLFERADKENASYRH